MKHKKISNLENGESVLSFFVLRKKEIKTKKDGSPYLSLELGDASGRIRGTMWDNANAAYAIADVGNIVKLQGVVTTYRDEMYITVEKFRKSQPKDNVELSQLLPETKKDVRIMTLRLFSIIDSLKSPQIKKLLHLIFDDINFKNKFSKAPAAKLWHQNYLGGLLEHTLQVVDICDKVFSNYEGVKRDILIAGALLHDIGKVQELSVEGFIDYSDKGRLVGHIVMGHHYVASRIEQINDFPEPLANQILHLILSHHGQRENGAPIVPMSLEAMILHCADYLDSQCSAFTRIIQSEKEAGKTWSKYVNLIDRYIYLGEDEPEGKPTGNKQLGLI